MWYTTNMNEKKINEKVLEWYQKNKRDLPWRKSKNAYYIWVSEIMLQQTRVETVKPYYARFIEQLPTIVDLANCDEDKLMKLWQGLGYYSRVKNMQKAAMICVEQHNGSMPSNYQELLALPGIGPYTAGAIASIAYNQPVAAIDGNVMRIYARLYNIGDDITALATKKKIEKKINLDINDHMGDYNQALMDIGSAICSGNGVVYCNICPLLSKCQAYKKNTVYTIPVKKKAKKKRDEKITSIVYICNNQVLIHKRKDTGLLASLYEFVTKDSHLTKKEVRGTYLGKYKHIFSHVVWDIKGYVVELDAPIMMDDYIWVSLEDIETKYSIPTAFLPVYKDALDRRERFV